MRMGDPPASITVYTDPLREDYDPKAPHLLREWWHQILRQHGRYACYAVFLLLPADWEARRYVKKFDRELDLISGADCLIIALGKNNFRRLGVDQWGRVADRQATAGYSLKVAQLFEIDLTELPCLVVFEDIRSPSHIAISLKEMTAEEIAERMRSLFSIIHKAISEKNNPLAAIEKHRNQENLRKAGQTIVSNLRTFVGATFEAAMEAWIRATISKP
jgi:hypothetical protein